MNRKNKIAAGIMVLIGVAIFAWEMRSLDVAQVMRTLAQLNPWWLLAAVVVMLTSWVIEAAVVQIFVHHLGEHLPFKAALRVPLVEQLFNNITPFASGGQPAQLVALMQAGVEGGRASSVLLMKFIVYQFMVLINFILTIVIGYNQIATQFGALKWFILFGFVIHVVVIVGLLLVMYRYRFTKRMAGWAVTVYGWFVSPAKKAAFDAQLTAKIDTFYQESLHLKEEKKKVVKAALMTLVQLLFYYAVPYFVLRSFGVTQVSLIEVMVLHVMIVMIVSLFPVPGGTGGAEYSFKTLFATYVPTASQLVLAMLLWRVLTYYLGMFLGGLALAVSPNQLRRAPEKK